MRRFPVISIISIILILTVVAGCGTERGGVDPLARSAGGPATPEELITRLAAAYADRDLGAYADLLAKDFAFSTVPCGVDDLGRGPVETMWGRDEELTIAGRMFSGKACVNSRGASVPAVLSITVDQCELRVPWKSANESGRPEVLRAVYRMRVRLMLETGRMLLIDGPTTFYAEPAEDPVGGTTWKLRGWVDEG